jgi:hypothetical protein
MYKSNASYQNLISIPVYNGPIIFRHEAEIGVSVEFPVDHLFCFVSLLFCKKRTTHKISVLQQKLEGGTVLQTTNALTGRISSNCLGYS